MRRTFRYIALLAILALLTMAFASCKKQEGTVVHPEPKPQPKDTSGLSDADRAFALYETAKENQANAGGIDASLSAHDDEITIRNDNEETNWDLDIQWTSKQPAEDSSQFVDHLTESIVKGNDVTEREVFYGNGTLYTSQGGKKYRQMVERRTALAETALFTLPEMTKAAFADPQITSENGNTCLSLFFDSDILSEELLAEDGALVYLLGGYDDTLDYTFDDIGVVMEIDEIGCFARFTIYYTVQLNDDVHTCANVHLTITYDNSAKEISVKLPNEKDYKERIGSGLSKEAYEVMTDVVDLLFGADGKRIDHYKNAYKSACDEYGKDIVDEIVEWFEEQ